jgi:Tfp pilus assembly protein PilO
MYEAAKKDELKQLLQEQQHCTAMLEQLESEWLQIQDSIEQITLDE